MKSMKIKLMIGLLIFGITTSMNSSADRQTNQALALAFLQALGGNNSAPITTNNMSTICSGNDVRYWNNCVGVVRFPNGNIYSGQFRNGQREGVGSIRVLAPGQPSENYIGSNIPSTYVGEFHDGRINGVGTWYTDSGVVFRGRYVNNILVEKFDY